MAIGGNAGESEGEGEGGGDDDDDDDRKLSRSSRRGGGWVVGRGWSRMGRSCMGWGGRSGLDVCTGRMRMPCGDTIGVPEVRMTREVGRWGQGKGT